MAVVDDREGWRAAFEAGWLKTYTETGELDWANYNLPRNTTSVEGPAIDLKAAKLAVISTGGFYIEGEQEPFDEPDLHGRYDIRLLPIDARTEDFSISHTHYDHTAANEDRQVLLPIGHLKAMVEAGEIGELAPSIVSFMGYQPDVTRVEDETIPAVLSAVQSMGADAAILIPA
jgi:glycine/betaine/sarcosine/D-proline reductase family selenoprotein B